MTGKNEDNFAWESLISWCFLEMSFITSKLCLDAEVMQDFAGLCLCEGKEKERHLCITPKDFQDKQNRVSWSCPKRLGGRSAAADLGVDRAVDVNEWDLVFFIMYCKIVQGYRLSNNCPFWIDTSRNTAFGHMKHKNCTAHLVVRSI